MTFFNLTIISLSNIVENLEIFHSLGYLKINNIKYLRDFNISIYHNFYKIIGIIKYLLIVGIY